MRPLQPVTIAPDLMLQPPKAIYRGSIKSGASKKKKVLSRFRRIVRLVMIARYWFRCGRPPKLSHKESILFFLDIPTVKHEANRGTLLRKPSFNTRASKDVTESAPDSITSVAKRILAVSPSYRTDNQVHQLVQTLGSFSKFSGYPEHVQRRICKQGWYSRFDPSRIMVRQQQMAESYYFLLSGIAISRTVDDQKDLGESRRMRAIFLRKGDTIGEKELLQNIHREVTIVTKDTVDVLGLDKEDFLDIFQMVMGEKLDFLPFLKTIGELLFFPLELLQAHHCACSVQNYRRGAVITRNSNDADWIYVIKMGTCQVFRAVRGSRDRQRRSTPNKMATSEAPEPELLVPPGMFPAISSAKSNSELTVPKRQIIRKRSERSSKNPAPRRSISEGHLPRLMPGGHLVSNRYLGDDLLSVPSSPYSDDEQMSESISRHKRHSKSGSFPTSGYDETENASQSLCLQTLVKGSIFGLQTLIYEDGPALMLVSQGAECIMVSKQFLRDHLDSTTLNKLRNTVPPYPSITPMPEATR